MGSHPGGRPGALLSGWRIFLRCLMISSALWPGVGYACWTPSMSWGERVRFSPSLKQGLWLPLLNIQSGK